MSTKALFRAVQNENVAEVKKLLSNKVVTHGRDKDQQTVLHIAASSGNLGLVQLLLKKVWPYPLTPPNPQSSLCS